MSQYNGSDGLTGALALDEVLDQLRQAALQAGATIEGESSGRPAWAQDRPENNPIVFESLPEAPELDQYERGDPRRYPAIRALVQWVHFTMLEAIEEGGPKGVSSNDLFWAWEDSGYDKVVPLGMVMATLTALDLVDYDPTLDKVQQVVVVGEVIEKEWQTRDWCS